MFNKNDRARDGEVTLLRNYEQWDGVTTPKSEEARRRKVYRPGVVHVRNLPLTWKTTDTTKILAGEGGNWGGE